VLRAFAKLSPRFEYKQNNIKANTEIQNFKIKKTGKCVPYAQGRKEGRKEDK
jgi:hypothetical protein